MRYVIAAASGLLLVITVLNWVHSETLYVGAEKCKLCHRSIYESWARTTHRQATERLTVGERATGCIRCHATGPKALPGVQCEACHGPGASYWPPEIMMDPAKAREAGLISPTESTCRACHGSGLPNQSSRFLMPSESDRTRAFHK